MNHAAKARIRNDILRKTSTDIFKLMEQNYNLLTIAGHPNDSGMQFTFIVTTLTTVLSSTLRIFSVSGLNKELAKGVLEIMNKAVMEALAEAEEEEKRTQEL